MANTATVEIIIQAQDKTKAALQSAVGQLAALEKGAMAASIAFGALAAAGTALISKITMYAARTEELGIVLEQVTRTTGHNIEQVRAQEEAVKALGITTQVSREILIRMMAAELDLADATRIARAAQDLAVIGMRNSSEAAADLLYAITSLQPRLIRKYGIYVTLVEVYKDAAEALSKNVDELTALEKRQAFTNAILDAAAGYTGAYEAAMTSASKQIRSFRRYTEELANQFGAFFLPLLAEAVGVATEFVKALMALPAPVKEAMMSILLMGTAIAGAVSTAGALVLLLPKLAAAFGFLIGPIGLVAVAIGALVGALLLMKQQLTELNVTFKESEKGILASSASYEQYRLAAISALEAIGRITVGTATFARQNEDTLGGLVLSRQEFGLYKWAVEESEGAVLTFADAQAYLAQHLEDADRAMHAVAEGQRAVTRAMKDGDEAFREGAKAAQYWADEHEQASKRVHNAVVQTELAAREAAQEIAEHYKEMGLAFARDVVEVMTKSVADMQGVWDKFQADAETAWDNYSSAIESTLLSHQISVRESEIKHQRQRVEIIAEATAEITALEAAGQTEKADAARAAMDEELERLDYNYQKQKAWAEWHWEIQQLMQEQAHYERLLEMAQFAQANIKLQYDLTEATINALAQEASEKAVWARYHIDTMAQAAGATIDWARVEVLSMQAVQESRENLLKGLDISMGEYEAKIAAISESIRKLIEAGPDLPPLPDFSQWVGDYTSGVSEAGSKVQESATKTLQEVTVDIAEAFKAAMEIFEEVAGYVTPIGLAAGMEALRKDIQEAVRQLYIAYDAIGKEGVEGAGLIAESAQAIMAMIGSAVEAFGLLEDYGSVMTEDMDKFIDDLEYILTAVRTRLLDLWGWEGARIDTVWGHMETWADAVGSVMSVIEGAVLAFELLREYQGIMPAAIDKLVTDIDLVLTKLQEIVPQFEDRALEAALEFATLAAATVEALGGAIDTLVALAGFAPSEADMRAGIDAFFASLEHFLDEFAWGMWRWEDLASKKTIEIAELLGQTVTALGAAVQPLLDIAEYAPDQAAFRNAVNMFFANLEYFLDEFAWGMWRWEDLAGEKPAEIAELLGQTMAGFGEAVQPLLDIADYSVTPGEAERAAQLFFQSLEIFLDTFAWEAEKFEGKVDPALTGLAEAIGALMSGIGAAVGPLMELAQYGIIEVELGGELAGVTYKTLLNLEDVQKSFDLFFLHLGMILADFEEASKEWEVSDAAQVLATAIGELASSLDTALRFLNDVAVYGAETADSAARGFQTFLRDIRRILSDLEEANETMGPALVAAEEFALTAADVLSAIQEGISDLNSLGELEEMPDLVEAGINLIKSLEDGMLSQADKAVQTAVAAVKFIIDTIIVSCEYVWGPQLFAAGAGLGSTFIDGMIAGLTAQEDVLYSTIARIIQNATAATGMAGLGGLGFPARVQGAPAGRDTGGMGHSITIENVIMLDGREVARVVDNRLADRLRAEGVRLSWR